MKDKEKDWKRKRKGVLVFELVLLIAILLAGGAYFYLQHQLDQTMGNKVSILGIDVSLLPLSEAVDKIEDEFAKSRISFTEQDETVFETTFRDAGISLDHSYLEQELLRIKEHQGSTKLFGETMKNYTIDWRLDENEEKSRAVVSESNFRSDADLRDAADAYITYDEDSGFYSIVPDIAGNRINEDLLYDRMNTALTQELADDPIDQTVCISIDEDLYLKAATLADDPDLVARMEGLNDTIQGYLNSTVTYLFGNVTEMVDEAMIRSWLIIDGEDIYLDEDQIWNYVDNLAATYNTLYIPRYLESSLGGTVELSNNEYGYWIVTDDEFDQLLSDLHGGTAIEREPVYDSRGYQRNGVDDLCGSYVEISIAHQHLWMYKDGVLITETDIVTGQPVGINTKTNEKESWATCEGAYELAYKESPSVLSSDIYGYSVKVQYWMPFVLGQGLHDLSSRTAFGGEIYKTNGSHGCVNLPTDQAALIYENIEEGYPILIY